MSVKWLCQLAVTYMLRIFNIICVQSGQHLMHESLARDERALDCLVALVRTANDGKLTTLVLKYLLGEMDDLPKVLFLWPFLSLAVGHSLFPFYFS